MTKSPMTADAAQEKNLLADFEWLLFDFQLQIECQL
jgi:hypothetical protein